MLTIKIFQCNALQENCYVVSDETRACVIIDCGARTADEYRVISDYIRQQQLRPQHLIATHGHVDHNYGNGYVYAEFGLTPEVHERDLPLMATLHEQSAQFIGLDVLAPVPPVQTRLKEGDRVDFGIHQLTVIETPGHTPGGIVLYDAAEHVAFSGDTLFRSSIGRTDLPGGSMFEMMQSLRMICQLPDETKVFPGHGAATTIGEELMHNPYLDR